MAQWLKRALDPREYGFIGDGVADDTAAIQATINAGGPGGVTEIPARSAKIGGTLALPTGHELVGTGAKGTEFVKSSDAATITTSGGEGQAVRNIRVVNSITGARNTYDLDFTNPTKVALRDVEVSLPDTTTGKGGVRFLRNNPVGGDNAFMPDVDGLWVRNGHFVADGVTDGHLANAWIWGHNAGSAGTVEFLNAANGWTVESVDVVPGITSGAGFYVANTSYLSFVGCFADGSYAEIMTGFGLYATSSRAITVTGCRFWNLGKSGVRLAATHGCTFTGNIFADNNKADGSHPDIDIYGSVENTFVANGHGQSVVRTNKGAIYREDAGSGDNFVDLCTMDHSLGSTNYASPLAVVNSSASLGTNNRPRASWPAGV